jgi:hypothetical protein
MAVTGSEQPPETEVSEKVMSATLFGDMAPQESSSSTEVEAPKELVPQGTGPGLFDGGSEDCAPTG